LLWNAVKQNDRLLLDSLGRNVLSTFPLQISLFADGELKRGNSAMPRSCRKCFRNYSILLVAGQLRVPLHTLHRTIIRSMEATGDSTPKYSPPAFYKMQIGPKEFTQIDQSRLKQFNEL